MNAEKNNIIIKKTGFYSSLSLAIMTLITFGFAMMAVPPAGPYCPADCMEYPYPDILSYYPRDYLWMYLAVIQLFVFVVFVVSNHYNAPSEKRIFSFTSVAFALISATVLLLAYYIQFAVIPVSMMKGETEGMALLTQYNGHGIFVVMEELGYITMSISLLFLAPLFAKKKGLEKLIRLILILTFALTALSFILYLFTFGIDREYRFEVAAISINWLSLIITGILLSIFYKRLTNAIK